MNRSAALLVGIAAATAVLPSCTCRGDDKRDPAPIATAAPTLAAPAPSPAPPARASSIDPIHAPEGCVLTHEGPFIDLGEPALDGHVEPRDPERTSRLEREGATWTRFRDPTASVTFLATADDVQKTDATLVQARVRGLGAKTMSAYLNGKLVGTMRLTKNEDVVVGVHAPPGGTLLTEGENELTLRFRGAPRGHGDDLAEVDWVHVGSGDPDPTYAAPTRLDVRTSATLGGVAKQSLAMLADSSVRCTGWLPTGGRIELAAGLSGPGEADVEVRLLKDRQAPVVLRSVHVSGATSWIDGSVPLGNVGPGGTLGGIEIAVVHASKGARVLVGEPRVVAPEPRAFTAPKPARGVVLVVMGELAPKAISLYGGKITLPELANLARDGIVFEAHRASSTLSHGAFAAILTGRSPRDVHVDDEGARLPADAVTLGDMARQAGIVAAYFTANPTTGAAFGFGRSWAVFAEHAPGTAEPAVRVFDEASAWLDAHKTDRFLLVVDARGGHPPWDITPDELKSMPPDDYGGGLDPKHAAELLSRARHIPPQIRFTDADRERAAALYEHALVAHDAALGRLMAALRTAGRDADTTVIVTSDIGVNEAAHVPYGDGDPPEEGVLSLALVLRDASRTGAGTRVGLPTVDVDVAPTVTGTLGLSPSSLFRGSDLRAIAAGDDGADGRPRLATVDGRFALRWGTFILSGRSSTRAELCDLSLDASCVADIRATHPLALDAVTRTYRDLTAPRPPDGAITPEPPAPVRDPAALDPRTQAALKAWGR